MKNNDETIQNDIIQDTVLDSVAGGIRIGVPRKEGNMDQITRKRIDEAWERVKEKMNWHHKNRELDQKDRELDQQAKEMWINSGFKITDILLGLFKK